jgi:hypothetical protein
MAWMQEIAHDPISFYPFYHGAAKHSHRGLEKRLAVTAPRTGSAAKFYSDDVTGTPMAFYLSIADIP